MTTSALLRNPAVFGTCYGCAWIGLMPVFFGSMVTGHNAAWEIRGLLIATALLPLFPRLFDHHPALYGRVPPGLGSGPGGRGWDGHGGHGRAKGHRRWSR